MSLSCSAGVAKEFWKHFLKPSFEGTGPLKLRGFVTKKQSAFPNNESRALVTEVI